jgi:hypothetical protein
MIEQVAAYNTTITVQTRLGKTHSSLHTTTTTPRANYTDRATAACRRSDCQLFADRGCYVASVTDPYGHILDFTDRSLYFCIK